MGAVYCGKHNVKCCWRCDDCPTCSGKFSRLLKGDYCPDCTEKIKAEGGVWSPYHQNYIKREIQPAPLFDHPAEAVKP